VLAAVGKDDENQVVKIFVADVYRINWCWGDV
jgi:hypothetical protein